MGIAGLWKLLLPIGRRISLETLAGKVLAIDASIWWIQLEQALRRREGNDNNSSTATFSLLIKLFLHRLCKLKFYNIRPVFVLDGKTPEIKLRTLRQRRKQQGGDESYERSERHLQRIAKQLLQKQLLASTSKAAPKNAVPVEEKKKNDEKKASDSSSRATTSASFAPGFDPGAQQKKQTPSTEESAAAISSLIAEQQQHHQAIVQDDEVDISPEQSSPTNDWDDISSFNHKEDSSEENKHFHSTIALTLEQQSSLKDQIQSVWKLPPHERKAALELIQRQYRLQSRKEFMPAAAQPQHFSQVQLKHFLKSCQLRQAVVKQHGAHSDTNNLKNSTGKKRKLWGQPTAYDRSVRVELIRETDEDSSFKVNLEENGEEGGFLRSQDSKRSANDNVSCGFLAHGKKFRTDNSSSDRAAASGPLSSNMYDNNTNNSEDMDSIAHQEQLLKDRQLAEALQNLEYEQDGDASALMDQEENSVDVFDSDCFVWQDKAYNDLTVTKPPTSSSPIEVNDDSDIDWEDGDATEGARIHEVQGKSDLHETRPLPKKPIEVNTDSDVEREGGDAAEKVRIQEDQFNLKETKPPTSSPIEVNDDSDILWEEGNDDNESDELTLEKAIDPEGIGTANNDGNSEYHLDEREVESDDEEVRNFTSQSPKIHTDNNNQQTNIRLRLKPKPTPLRNTTSFVFDEISHEASRNAFEDDYGDLPQSDAMNTEALEQAQKTASNLANWAGRVFRRAMKEVHETSEASPAKSQEKRHQADASGLSPAKTFDLDRKNIVKSITISSTDKVDAHSSFRLNEADDNTFSRSVQSKESPREPSRTLFDPLEGFDPSMLAWNDEQIDEDRMQRQRDENNGAGEIRDEMRETLLQLLRLFGVPYVEAPAEAEAQCVELERLGLVDGIVTEDSDAFVFGGNTVYKNMFDEMKYVEVYRASDAEKEMSLGRNEMVALALLLGGDYTEGVRGVGIVNAMEVLDAFDMSNGPKEGLTDFYKWLISFSPLEDVSTEAKKNEGTLSRFEEFARKHSSAKTRWETPGNFPSDRVITAYMSPVVDNSPEKFTWGTPDLENLVPFCSQYIGWSREETVKVLEPVMKKASSGYHQTRIDSYMKYEDSIKFAKVRSKRLRKVLGLEDEPNYAASKGEVQLK